MEPPKSTARVQRANLDEAQGLRRFPHGSGSFIEVGTVAIGRAVLEPGWRWSTDIKPLVGTQSCQVHHLHIHALTASDRPLVIHRLSLAASPYRPLTHLLQRQPPAVHTASASAGFLLLSCDRRAMPGAISHFSCTTQNSITSQPLRTAVRTSIACGFCRVLTPQSPMLREGRLKAV